MAIIEATPSLFPSDGSLSASTRYIGRAQVPAAYLEVPVQEQLSLQELEPTVRAARLSDLDALADIELRAYADVYGVSPKPEMVADVRYKYAERIELLGDLVRVLERPDRGVYGVIVGCTPNKEREDFLAEEGDMTSNEMVRKIYDPNGKNAYIVNLAVAPEHQGEGGHFSLFADAIQLGMDRGVDKAYFESRLPGFDRWLEGPWVRQYRQNAEEYGVPQPTDAELANVYWKLTDLKGGVEKPRDALLRIYTDLGAKPLRLVEDAWKPDSSSRGFGVLCEYELPKPEVQALEAPEVRANFMQKAIAWARQRRLGLFALGAAGAGFAFEAARGGLGQMVEDLRESATWAGPAYGASWALIGVGVLMMIAGGRNKVRLTNLLKHPGQELADAYNESALVRAGFLVNAVGSVAAAGVVVGAVVTGLPVAAWSALYLPLADLGSTLATRYAAKRGAEKRKLTAPAK